MSSLCENSSTTKTLRLFKILMTNHGCDILLRETFRMRKSSAARIDRNKLMNILSLLVTCFAVAFSQAQPLSL